MWNCRNVQRTVYDLYKYAVEEGENLFPQFTSEVAPLTDFWADFVDHQDLYEKYFAKRYKSYRYYDQDIEGDNPVEDVLDDFQDAVLAFLHLNDKKYTQLYKIELINNMNPLDDYSITETKTGTKNTDREYVSGQREDRSSQTLGAYDDTTLNQVMAFNSQDFVDSSKTTNSMDERINSSVYNKGEQTDTEDTDVSESTSRTETGYKNNPVETLIQYKEAWDGFSFYASIFDDICKELLLV